MDHFHIPLTYGINIDIVETAAVFNAKRISNGNI